MTKVKGRLANFVEDPFDELIHFATEEEAYEYWESTLLYPSLNIYKLPTIEKITK